MASFKTLFQRMPQPSVLRRNWSRVISNRRIAFLMADRLQFHLLQSIPERRLHLSGLTRGYQTVIPALHANLGDLSVFVFRKNEVRAGTAIRYESNTTHTCLGDCLEFWCDCGVTSGVFNDHEAFSLQRTRCG